MAQVQTNSTIAEKILNTYPVNDYFDEMMGQDKTVRPVYSKLADFLGTLTKTEVVKRANHAQLAFLMNGVTYTVYGDASGTERIIPFDIMPRLLDHAEWSLLSKGLSQRIRALNAFLKDVYFEQNIFREKIIPEDLVLKNPQYRPEMKGVKVPGDVYINISGIDIIRNDQGGYFVLEDNLRCPSGVSYVLENRDVMQRVMPELFNSYSVEPVSRYTRDLYETLVSMSAKAKPNIVLLTPGVYNSAYFEHAFLAAKMGIHLVEGRDLATRNNKVFMKTTHGLEQVDVVYRRIDEDFLDPKVFRKDSTLGVAGLFNCMKSGNVAIANAIGTGIADDKAIYAYVPKMIEFYLGEKPLIPNIKTYFMSDENDRNHVLENIRDMVIKPTGGSGGYGMLIGSMVDKKFREVFIANMMKNPESFIAQPIIKLSCHPTFIKEKSGLEPRHIDLRPFILMDAKSNIRLLPGGLSRVALKEGSLVVNSSQGGGGKDTWVLSKSRKK